MADTAGIGGSAGAAYAFLGVVWFSRISTWCPVGKVLSCPKTEGHVLFTRRSAVRNHACVDRVTPILATQRGQRISTSRTSREEFPYSFWPSARKVHAHCTLAREFPNEQLLPRRGADATARGRVRGWRIALAAGRALRPNWCGGTDAQVEYIQIRIMSFCVQRDAHRSQLLQPACCYLLAGRPQSFWLLVEARTGTTTRCM